MEHRQTHGGLDGKTPENGSTDSGIKIRMRVGMAMDGRTTRGDGTQEQRIKRPRNFST